MLDYIATLSDPMLFLIMIVVGTPMLLGLIKLMEWSATTAADEDVKRILGEKLHDYQPRTLNEWGVKQGLLRGKDK